MGRFFGRSNNNKRTIQKLTLGQKSSHAYREGTSYISGDNNKLYVIGGRQADNGSLKFNFDRIEMYNPLNDSWTVMEQMPTKRSGIAVLFLPVDGNIYVIRGENPFKDEGPVRTLDIVETTTQKATAGLQSRLCLLPVMVSLQWPSMTKFTWFQEGTAWAICKRYE